MAEGAANPKGKRPGFWPRAAFVAFASLGTLVVTGMNGYYIALITWYLEPGTGHLDVELSIHYSELIT
jgi:hypothetical protein